MKKQNVNQLCCPLKLLAVPQPNMKTNASRRSFLDFSSNLAFHFYRQDAQQRFYSFHIHFIKQFMEKLSLEEQVLLQQLKQSNCSADFFVDKLFTRGLRLSMTKVARELSLPQLKGLKSELQWMFQAQNLSQEQKDHVSYASILLGHIIKGRPSTQNQSPVGIKEEQKQEKITKKNMPQRIENSWDVCKRAFKQFLQIFSEKGRENQRDDEERQFLRKLE